MFFSFSQWLSAGQTEATQSQRAEDGKTELSLMRFSLVHPQWRPPGHSSKFLGQLRGRVQQDAAALGASSVCSPPTPGVLTPSSPLVSQAWTALCPHLQPLPSRLRFLTFPVSLLTHWSSLLFCLAETPFLLSGPLF